MTDMVTEDQNHKLCFMFKIGMCKPIISENCIQSICIRLHSASFQKTDSLKDMSNGRCVNPVSNRFWV
jgi:hypothetical protein